ncbi:MAG: TAXI family TRAP transporter solute-binding subunit [Proteobacteria bacterium]|nr:TAXI family TRAP transporter solute-binding subunit [Pseudomonadota bacterium]
MKHPFYLITLILFISLSLSLPLAAKTTFLTIGTAGLTGVYYPTGGAIAKIVNKKRREFGIRLTVESTEGSIYNVDAIMKGEFDFGIVQSDTQYFAVKGMGPWKNKGPQTELRSVFSIYPESCSLVAAADSNINSLSDLKGKRVNLGNSGSGHLENSLDILEVSGFNPKTDLTASYSSIIDVPGLLQNGSLDAFFYTVGHPSSALKEATAGGRKVRFISLYNRKIDQLVKSLPYYSKMVIPMKHYSGALNKRDISTFGVCATLVTSSKIADSIVYAITKTVFENIDSFKKLHPAYAMITKESMLKCISAPLHPGALKYYREIGVR